MPDRPNLIDVENAFQPAQEIDVVEKFSGRRDAFENSYFGLMSIGSNIDIVGNRGIGKTSLARQIEILACGNNELVERLELGHCHEFDFLVAYYACGRETNSIEDMLARILASEHGLGSWLYYLTKTSKMLKSLSPSLSAKLFGTGFELGGEGASEVTTERVTVPTTMQGVFENVAHDILNGNGPVPTAST